LDLSADVTAEGLKDPLFPAKDGRQWKS